MKLNLQEDVSLAELTTFKIGGEAKYFIEVASAKELPDIFKWLKDNNLPYFILGGGSNTVFSDGKYPGLVIKMNIMGFEVVSEDVSTATIKVGSGENWDELVAKTVDMGLAGMEALSGIPGSTGAAPVQNIGAYGQEAKDTIECVDVFDTQTTKLKTLSNRDCKFGYRDSIFKSSQKGRYIICFVNFKLSKNKPGFPKYKDVMNYFNERNIHNPDLKQIRAAILEIRSKKFVNPSVMPNAGSFFKNPIVEKDIAEKIIKKYPEIKLYPEDTKIFPNPDGTYKIAAGWLIQEAELKGKELDKVRIDPSHALVLENKGGATQKDLKELIDLVQKEVMNKFEIKLEPEPVVLNY
jgi:UDP-N-acetylmuramate dehydrogenase